MNPFLFQPLANPKPRTRFFVAGWGVQLVIIVTFIAVNTLFPEALPMATHYLAVNIIAPTAAPVPQKPQVRLKMIPPPPIHVTAPSPRHIDAPPVEAPAVVAENKAPNIPAPKPTPSNFGSSAKQTTTKPAIQVQTGGFGDPNGVAPDPNAKRPATIAVGGSFDLPQGSGHGNGLGGKIPGVTASTGFGNGTATGNGGYRKTAVTVTDSTFDKHEVERTAPAKAAEAPTTPAIIISKIVPQYTEEGRKLRIQGTVRVQVKLMADGKIQVLQVLNSLGHGLDEQAARAAQSIQFKPAQRSGQSTDSTVVLAISFQLAS